MDGEPSQFANFFLKPDQPKYRGKFHSRLFGIFNEELVRFWAADERSPYRNIGRPTIFNTSDAKRSTLDFTFEDRKTGKLFVVEMKCEIEFQNYRFMTLREHGQLGHHKKPAFDLFRSLALDPQCHRVQVHRQPIDISGAILIWGDVSESGRAMTIEACGFHDIVGIDRILEFLWLWQPEPFLAFVSSLHNWSNELYTFLMGKEQKMIQIFKKDDQGFIRWRDTHPEGFICNIPYPNARNEREYYLPQICLHKASCHQIATNKNGEQPWTTKDFFKICTHETSHADDWIILNADLPQDWQLRRCEKCFP